ncbi:MAG: DNA (cytosine-5-)-methyltransferase [Thermosynechococcaceae cyanobacterium]
MATAYSFVGLCSGAGGLDLGFELSGFEHRVSMDLETFAIDTLRRNRPCWNIEVADLRDFCLPKATSPDIILAGVPCQGFSLGGNRVEADPRNQLYTHVMRIAKESRPRVVVIENVLNLRTMKCPTTGRPFAQQISRELEQIGYSVFFDVFKMCYFGVPQTRRRFVFVAFLGNAPIGYHLPQPDKYETVIRDFLYDLSNDCGSPPDLPNHNPTWGFKSAVHVETHSTFSEHDEVMPVRFSRTASDGNPLRSFDDPFPAVDTATVWGWAQGHVTAKRKKKDRVNGKHIRNPNASVTLWRISASRLRSFTDREYARLQTFPDDWTFVGGNKRDIHKQIGNAVPVMFAQRLGKNISHALRCLDADHHFSDRPHQLSLF